MVDLYQCCGIEQVHAATVLNGVFFPRFCIINLFDGFDVVNPTHI